MVIRLIVVLLAAAPAVKLTPAPEQSDKAWSQELRFTDKSGEHLVRFTLSEWRVKKTGDEYGGRARDLLVVHTIGAKEIWRAKDFIEPCDVDATLEFLDGSIDVSDLDDDGEGEISFLYKLSCKGDVSPHTAKLLMYEGATKYALRGETKERVGEKEFAGGTFKIDPAFNSAPKPFLEFAKTKWKKLILSDAR